LKQKVLLVTSPAIQKNNFWTCSITSPIGSIMPPCDLASIAAVLRKNNIEPKILEMRHFKDPIQALKNEVAVFQPDAIVTNIGTASAIEDFEILAAAKDTVEKRICFCFHAMALPDELFEKGATHILAGDPEYSIVAAVRGETLEKGLWTKETIKREPAWISDLDSLPFPALDLIDIDAYHALIMGKNRFAILLSNRGCPYECPYCVLPFLFGHKFRTMSVNRVISEIEHNIKEFGIRSFFFIDSAININPQWTMEFCKEIQRRNLKIRWCSNMRIPPVTKELLYEMKKAGCFRLFYGVEDLDLLERLDRRTTTTATKEAFALTRSAGIETVAFIILFPDIDTNEKVMAKRIIKMVSDLKADAIQCNIAIPYPGSKMYNEYIDKYNMSKNWQLYDPAGNKYPYKSKLDLVKTRQLIYLGFFLKNPIYVWNIVKNASLRSIFTFLKNATIVLFNRK